MARTRESRPQPGQDWDADHWMDPPSIPEATEGGESMWQLWNEASQRMDLAFAPTQPSELVPLVEPPRKGGRAAAGPLTADSLMVVARRNNRVCPQPRHWAELYQRLRGERYSDLQPPPVQPAAWARLSSMQKRLLFRDHVVWAQRRGRLRDIAAFMEELEETDWVHMGED